jgi:hypothetical protein
MAGVAGQTMRVSAARATRFLVGLVVGEAVAGLFVAGAVYLVGTLLGVIAPPDLRLLAVAAAALFFGLADLRGRTPQVSRQVPRRLAYKLTSGSLGLVWGFDLGLLFTTQKTVSLLWLSVVGVLLVDPAAAPVALVVWSVVSGTTVVGWALVPNSQLRLAQEQPWIKVAKHISAVTMVATAVVSVLVAAG